MTSMVKAKTKVVARDTTLSNDQPCSAGIGTIAKLQLESKFSDRINTE